MVSMETNRVSYLCALPFCRVDIPTGHAARIAVSNLQRFRRAQKAQSAALRAELLRCLQGRLGSWRYETHWCLIPGDRGKIETLDTFS